MADTAAKETFFPGVRKAVLVDGVTPLANAAGEKRIKLDLIISLADNQILGIPEWLEDAIKLVQKASVGSGLNKSLIELQGVVLRFYAAFGDDRPAHELSGAMLKSFVVRRSSKETPSGELADTELAFQAYTYWSDETWGWAGKAFNSTIFTNFGTTQAKLSFGPPVEKKDGVPTAAKRDTPGPLFDAKSRAANDTGDQGITDDVDDDDKDLEHDLMGKAPVNGEIVDHDPLGVFSRTDGDPDALRAAALDPANDPAWEGSLEQAEALRLKKLADAGVVEDRLVPAASTNGKPGAKRPNAGRAPSASAAPPKAPTGPDAAARPPRASHGLTFVKGPGKPN